MIFKNFKKRCPSCVFISDNFINYSGIINNSKQSYEFILDHQDYHIATVDAPDVPEKEMVKALTWQAKQLYSDYDNLAFDFYPQPSNHQGRKRLFNVVSVSYSHISRVINKAKELSILLNRITIPEIIYKRNIHQLSIAKNHCIILIKKKLGKVVIFDDGDLCFSRIFNLIYQGSDSDYQSLLILELQRSLDYYERQYRLSMPSGFSILSDVENNDAEKLIKENISHNAKLYIPQEKYRLNGNSLSVDHQFMLSHGS